MTAETPFGVLRGRPLENFLAGWPIFALLRSPQGGNSEAGFPKLMPYP